MNRHERRKAAAKVRQMTAPASVAVRAQQFLEAFRDAPNDSDIEIRGGATERDEPALVINVNGSQHMLLTKEARVVANIMEEAMRAYPNDPEAGTLPNIIMGLRAAADQVERDPLPPRHF
jgi:hypothetical protein